MKSKNQLTNVIMRDTFIFDRQIDDDEEAKNYLQYCQRNYEGKFELKKVPINNFMKMLKSQVDPAYQIAIGSARK